MLYRACEKRSMQHHMCQCGFVTFQLMLYPGHVYSCRSDYIDSDVESSVLCVWWTLSAQEKSGKEFETQKATFSRALPTGSIQNISHTDGLDSPSSRSHEHTRVHEHVRSAFRLLCFFHCRRTAYEHNPAIHTLKHASTISSLIFNFLINGLGMLRRASRNPIRTSASLDRRDQPG